MNEQKIFFSPLKKQNKIKGGFSCALQSGVKAILIVNSMTLSKRLPEAIDWSVVR